MHDRKWTVRKVRNGKYKGLWRARYGTDFRLFVTWAGAIGYCNLRIAMHHGKVPQ